MACDGRTGRRSLNIDISALRYFKTMDRPIMGRVIGKALVRDGTTVTISVDKVTKPDKNARSGPIKAIYFNFTSAGG